MIRRTIAGQREYLDWTPQGQLAQLTSPAGDSSFVYDTTGTRLTRTTPHGSTLYLPGAELTADTHGTITGTRYYTIGGATVAVRTTPTAHDPDGPLTWIMADSQGSAQLTIPASDTTSTAAIQRYLPYGTIRGQRAITVTDRGYLSQALDSTGLIADGARYYDPTSGLILRHYTTQEAADAIEKGGTINPGVNSGKIWVTPDGYASGAEAQAQLALNKTPEGYFEFPASRVLEPSPPSIVEPYYDQPGGGTEITTGQPIDVRGIPFIPFEEP
jgi:hypothetical protein